MPEVSQLLNAIDGGAPEAADEFLPVVYEEPNCCWIGLRVGHQSGSARALKLGAANPWFADAYLEVHRRQPGNPYLP